MTMLMILVANLAVIILETMMPFDSDNFATGGGSDVGGDLCR
jgi:hypothetical protein